MGYSPDWPRCTDGDVAQMVERSLSMWEVGGSIPPVSSTLLLLSTLHRLFLLWLKMRSKKVLASSGNRTRAARVAGEHSTTEPTMLCTHASINTEATQQLFVVRKERKLWEKCWESKYVHRFCVTKFRIRRKCIADQRGWSYVWSGAHLTEFKSIRLLACQY